MTTGENVVDDASDWRGKEMAVVFADPAGEICWVICFVCIYVIEEMVDFKLIYSDGIPCSRNFREFHFNVILQVIAIQLRSKLPNGMPAILNVYDWWLACFVYFTSELFNILPPCLAPFDCVVDVIVCLGM